MENLPSRYDASTNDFPPNFPPNNFSPTNFLANDSPQNDSPINDATDESQSRVKILLGPASSFERTPQELKQLWESAQQEGVGSTARIFLGEGGFTAWFVYFLAKNASELQVHFQGKADLCRLITDLESASVASRKQLAGEIRSAISSDVRQKIDRVYEKKIKSTRDVNMSQRNKRRRTTDSHLLPPSPTDVPEAVATVNSIPPYHAFDHRALDEQPVRPIIDPSVYFTPDDQVFVNASLAVATHLLPRDLSNAVKRHPHPKNENTLVAAIGMSFPNNVECQMALEITPDKVQHYARSLFGVRLETAAGLRYICIGGAQVLPAPQFTLRGCKADIIPDTFGPEVSDAIQFSPTYQDDVVKNLRDCTHSVSMLISQQADEVAVIFLSLGLWLGTRIREELYKETL